MTACKKTKLNMKQNEFFPNCYFYVKDYEYYFSGLIASSKIINYNPMVIVCCIGVLPGKFIDVIVKNRYMKPNSYGLKGRAELTNEKEQVYSAYISHFY